MKTRLTLMMMPLLLGIVFFQSCEKDDVKVNRLDLLTDYIWVYDTLEILPTSDANFMLAAAFVHMAFQGSEYDFSQDSTYVMTSPNTTLSGTWELTDNKTIWMDKGTENEMQLEIVSISESRSSLRLHLEGEFFETPYAGDVIMKFNTK